MLTKLKKPKQAPAPPARREQVRAQLARAAGENASAGQDPLAYVTESFRQSFERSGAVRAAALGAQSAYAVPQSAPEPAGGLTKLSAGPPQTRADAALPGREDALRRFSETAFQRGQLSASVLRGTGKLMLVSCLKRTVGRPLPESAQERELLDAGAQERGVPGHAPDSVLFIRGLAGSAVGLVVDALRDARRVVESMQAVALASGRARGGEEGGTLRALYPFLDDGRERALLASYRRQLDGCASADERALLQNALVHTQALIGKKAQMKEEFINKLRLVSDRAGETLAELEAPGAAEEIAAAVLEQEADEEPAPPPPEDGGGHGEDSAAQPNGAQNGPGAGTDGAGAPA